MPINKRGSMDEFSSDEIMFEQNSSSQKPTKKLGSIITIFVIAILAVFITVAGLRYLPGLTDSIAKPSNSQWQGVFLTNGQVYFGKVKSVGPNTVSLKEIYYLQVVAKPLQRSQDGTEDPTQTQQELTLIKLGNEIHGPTDAMIINRDHVLLTVKLKDDSRVVQAINKYLEDLGR